MASFLIFSLLVIGVFLILIILLQRGRGGGLAGAFGGLVYCAWATVGVRRSGADLGFDLEGFVVVLEGEGGADLAAVD